ncbi:hypothetical protein Dimus_023458 [Dionaea muscipula]
MATGIDPIGVEIKNLCSFYRTLSNLGISSLSGSVFAIFHLVALGNRGRSRRKNLRSMCYLTIGFGFVRFGVEMKELWPFYGEVSNLCDFQNLRILRGGRPQLLDSHTGRARTSS